MILTCFLCPCRLAFAGGNRDGVAAAFGWRRRASGAGFLCRGCQGDETEGRT